MQYQTIEYSVENHIATITLNLPQALNAVTTDMIIELRAAAQALARDSNARCVVLTGNGKGFCAGGDLEEIKTSYGGNAGFIRHMDLVNSMILALTEIPKPTIAAVNGAAVGAGMNIALTCDIIIASEKAKFSQVFSNLGLVTDMGGAYFLPRLVGVRKAKELIFNATMLSADEALGLGIVNQVVPHGELAGTVQALAERYAAGPTAAYGLAKKIVNRSYETDIRTLLDYEGAYQSLCGATEDYKEGMAAFLEKRAPRYHGN